MGMQKWTDDYRRGDHAVHIYRDGADLSRVILDVLGWLEGEEKFVYVTDRMLPNGENGFSSVATRVIKEAIKEGRMEIVPSYSFYCPKGKFAGRATMDRWKEKYDRVLDQGYNSVIIAGDISWLSVRPSSFGSFMDYEQSIDLAHLPKTLSVLCQYDSRLFTPDQQEWASRVHQLRVRDGRLERNYWMITHRAASVESSPRQDSNLSTARRRQ